MYFYCYVVTLVRENDKRVVTNYVTDKKIVTKEDEEKLFTKLKKTYRDIKEIQLYYTIWDSYIGEFEVVQMERPALKITDTLNDVAIDGLDSILKARSAEEKSLLAVAHFSENGNVLRFGEMTSDPNIKSLAHYRVIPRTAIPEFWQLCAYLKTVGVKWTAILMTKTGYYIEVPDANNSDFSKSNLFSK